MSSDVAIKACARRLSGPVWDALRDALTREGRLGTEPQEIGQAVYIVWRDMVDELKRHAESLGGLGERARLEALLVELRSEDNTPTQAARA
jgi:hypothetical protein